MPESPRKRVQKAVNAIFAALVNLKTDSQRHLALSLAQECLRLGRNPANGMCIPAPDRPTGNPGIIFVRRNAARR